MSAGSGDDEAGEADDAARNRRRGIVADHSAELALEVEAKVASGRRDAVPAFLTKTYDVRDARSDAWCRNSCKE